MSRRQCRRASAGFNRPHEAKENTLINLQNHFHPKGANTDARLASTINHRKSVEKVPIWIGNSIVDVSATVAS